jgi:putative addiction module component (TIGR02574 family)
VPLVVPIYVERYRGVVTDRARKLMEEALGLSLAERAEMAAELIASLPSEPEVDEESPDPEWSAEIERRARAAMADADGGIPWEDVRAEILTELRSRRQ